MMRSAARLFTPLFCAVAFACGSDPVPAPDTGVDAGQPDPVDAGFPDSGILPDGGPPPDSGVLWYAASCGDCATDCAAEECLRNGAGQNFCADRCGTDLDGCIDGFACIDISQGQDQFFCIPPNASCEPPETTFGSSCFGDTTGCAVGRDHCEGDAFSLGYCTRRCFNDYECSSGYECALGDQGFEVCVATQLAPSERCGRALDPAEPPCAVDSDCAGAPGTLCVRSEPTLPGVCALPCPGGACGEGFACGATHRGPACLSARCECHGDGLPPGTPAGTRNLLDEALAAAGTSRCGLIWNIHDFVNLPADIRSDPYRLSFFDPTHNEPLRAPSWASGVVADLDAVAGAETPAFRAARMVERLADLVDRPAETDLPGTLDPVEPLATAVAAFITATGGTPNVAALRADAMDVSMELQLALASVVDAMRRAALARNAAAPTPRDLSDLHQYGPAFIARRADGFGLAPANSRVRTLLNEQFDYGRMAGAAVDLLDAIDQADLARFAQTPVGTSSAPAALLFSQNTPAGRIAIGDRESGVYTSTEAGFDGAWALLLDLGGDDVYRIPVAGNVTVENSVSVMIDLGGDDRYGYVEVPHALDGARLPSDAGGRYRPTGTIMEDNGPISLSDIPRQGGARVGTAIAIDLGAGRDEYRSLRMSQGTGIFGVGVLIDDGGDDTYEAEAAAQGAAAFGIGLLLDLGGDDTRRAYQFAQGFAYARAAGLLYDTAGNDAYLMDAGDPAVGGDPLYFNAQRPGRANSTLGQGFAFGRRADFSDRAFMSGGVGLLIDADGDDRYEGSVFAQGGGFWFGTGILADHSGHDTYDALWYGMSSGAHYALGLLLEGGGDDVYGGTFPRVNVTVGGAHDYSATFLIDESGNDTYYGSRITLGAGNVNGIGVFVDNAGDDRYLPVSDYGLGNAALSENKAAGSPRRKVKSVGLFIDAGGTDVFMVNGMPAPEGIGDDSAWVQSRDADPAIAKNERGSGVDGRGESTLHFRR